MTIQIASPELVEKIERLAKLTGMTETSAVERAVDLLLSQQSADDEEWRRFDAILEQFDRLPKSERPFDPLEWDEQGLPR